MANDIIDIIVTDNSDNVQLNVTPNLVSINVSQTSGNIIGSNYYLASTFSALPITGDLTTLYVINDTSLMYRWSGSTYAQINSSAVVAWGQITGTLSGQTDLQNALNAKAPLASPTFTGTVSGITKSMVGLSNVDNTSDVNKPISTATQTALNLKADINNPTFTGTVGGITKAMVGLGNVDNTSDVNKPISSATQTALDTKAPLASPTFTGTVSGITKSMVGLGNVDNTTDLLKPISTATQNALNLKYDASNPAGYTTNVGTVTSVGGTGTVSGLSLSGSVTTSGNLTLGGTLSLTSGNVTTALGYTPYNATNPSGYISGITSGQVTTALGYTPENSANKGIANGYASLDGGGLVPSTQLPSYVDDVLEFADLASFPASGTTGKIYVALDTNKIYRWSGATYIEVSPTVGTIWGGITGTLSNQTDLQTALNAKQNNLSGTGFVKSTAGTISYDTATYYPYPTGTTTQYVAGDGSLIAFPVAGQAGTIVRLVRNQTGATLTKGTVVYIDGATGNNPTVAKAIATGDSTSAQTFGLCQANISNNAEGYVVIMGDLVGLNTSAFTEGQQLYLSSTTAGEYTTTKQYAPAHLVYVGVVTRSHVSLGQIEVRIQNGYEMDELHNVSAQSPSNNDGLFYNTTTSLWEKKSIATVLGYTSANAARSLTINGTAYDLTSDRSWSVGTVTSVAALTLGTTGTDVSSSVATGTTTPVITLNIPTASATNRGALSATDWSTFNNKQGTITLTTTGTSGAATFSSGTLNIPQYQAVLTNPVTGTGTSGHVTYWNGSGSIAGSANHFWDNTNGRLGIGTASPGSTLDVNGNFRIGSGTVSAPGIAFRNSTNSGFYLTDDGLGALINLGIGATNIATFKYNGNVGIGTTAPLAKATVRGGNLGNSVNMASTVFSVQGNDQGIFMGSFNGTPSYGSWIQAGREAFDLPFNLILQPNGGNVGIGTSSPSAKLDVIGNIRSFISNIGGLGGNISLLNDFGNNGGHTLINMQNAGTICWIKAVINGPNSNSGADLLFATPSTDTNGTERMRITSGGDVLISTSSSAANPTGFARVLNIRNTDAALVLSNTTGTAKDWSIGALTSGSLAIFDGSSERMRITSGGNVGIGLSSTPDKLGVQGTANNWTGKFLGSTVSGNSFGVDIVAGTTDGDYPLYIRTTNYSLRLFVRGDGVCYIGASSWVYNSDRRVKENILDVTNGLDLVSKLKPKHFDYINGAKDNLGFIAQEVQELIPQAVTISDEKTGMLGLKTDFIIPYLVKSIQELSAEITILKNK